MRSNHGQSGTSSYGNRLSNQSKPRQNVLLGVVEWIEPGAYEHAERVILDLQALKIKELRTGLSWADWHTPGGPEWYDWLIPQLAQHVNILPCLNHTPPSLGEENKINSPPRDPKEFADFVDLVITRYGQYFGWVELWNEPNNLSEWDWRLDPDWVKFGQTVGGAAYWARERGKKVLLGGMSPIDPNWLDLMFARGVMQYVDAVGVHGFPGTFDPIWEGWASNIGRVRSILEKHGSKAEIWITETGFSTWQHNEREQIREFQESMLASVDRVYWYGLYDLPPERPTIDGFHLDEREYHFGLKQIDGRPKLLYRILSNGGSHTIRKQPWLSRPPHLNGDREKHVLITGGAGFIGTNLAHHLLSGKQPVLILDNLSRPGVEENVAWLRREHGNLVKIEVGDVRDAYCVRRCMQHAKQVFHFAAQVAVTTSLANPLHDFDVNGRGTVNVLEAVRLMKNPPPLVFTSTNKVYGGLEDVKMRDAHIRYEPESGAVRKNGINELRPLDFHSPYGCSKGTADQYVIDYCRSYGIKAVVFRMRCIYGPHQFGAEDQGWVAHFLISAIKDQPIILYGDGKQVRDILFVEDLVNAFLLAQQNMHTISGQAFNIGGGPEQAISLLELLNMIGEMQGMRPDIRFSGWRQGDQRYYVSDTRKFQQATGWRPMVSVREGVGRLAEWLIGAEEIEGVPALK